MKKNRLVDAGSLKVHIRKHAGAPLLHGFGYSPMMPTTACVEWSTASHVQMVTAGRLRR
jgi:hypothetical protein